MVGIVVVSHSRALAQGVVELARQMASDELQLEAAGGIDEEGVLGTDPERVRRAITRAMSPDGVLVLMDLGSALMSAEFAIELLGGEAGGPVKLSAAPLIEGTVAAAVAASGGASLEAVAAEARGALAMKTAQIDDDDDEPMAGAVDANAERQSADASAVLPVANAIGLHARPAARFVQALAGFEAEVLVSKPGGRAGWVRANSLTNLISLGARLGDALSVRATGPEAEAAVQALVQLAATGFGDGISEAAAAGPAAVQPTAAEVPQALEAGTRLHGVPAATGLVVGPAHVFGAAPGAPPPREPGDAELTLLEHGLKTARTAIERDRELVRERAGESEAEIFAAHLALLDDEALQGRARHAIAQGANAERAWHDAAAEVAEIYAALEDPLLRERATDVLDVGRRVVAALTGGHSGPGSVSGILVAAELTPADTVGLDPQRVLGIATARGSMTTHAAILARSIGLPAVLGLGDSVLGVRDGATLLLDGGEGVVIVDPSPEAVTEARTRSARQAERAADELRHALEPGRTRDGTAIDVFANIGSVADAARAVEFGAQGVGMLRTEFLFIGRDALPDEDEQTQTLIEIARALDGRPLIVRTLDAGADKPLAALPMPAERNPYLGVRGIRLALRRSEVLATQFRAALRAAVEHPVRVMMPMVSTLAEVLAAKQILEQARAQTGIDAPLELGVTVEVPAAALSAAQLAPHVDFFSLGTNDLTQYTMAAERGDDRLAELLAIPQPAVLRLVRETVTGGATRARWTGVCGEMAGDPAAAVLLVGLGVTELSMAPALIPALKAALRRVDLEDARLAAEQALRAQDAAAARALASALLG